MKNDDTQKQADKLAKVAKETQNRKQITAVEKQMRLAETLRANLRRRKDQSRERKAK